MSSAPSARKKLVIVGDGGCGKTCLTNVLCGNEFPLMYMLRDLDNYNASVEVDGIRIELNIVDTYGQEEFDGTRPLSYPGADLILVCYALDSPNSLENVTEKWAPEVRRFCPKVPVILVGNKKDLRVPGHDRVEQCQGDVPRRLVGSEDGAAVARKIGASFYTECSAKSNDSGVRKLEVAVARLLPYGKRKKGRKGQNCRLL